MLTVHGIICFVKITKCLIYCVLLIEIMCYLHQDCLPCWSHTLPISVPPGQHESSPPQRPVSAPPTGLDECLFFISLVSDFVAVWFSVSSGCARRRSVSTCAAILVLHNVWFLKMFVAFDLQRLYMYKFIRVAKKVIFYYIPFFITN